MVFAEDIPAEPASAKEIVTQALISALQKEEKTLEETAQQGDVQPVA